MMETADPLGRAPLTPAAAARVLEEAATWDQSIRQRTEGITWMIWGTISAGLLMTLGFVTTREVPGVAVVASWTPWLLLGFLLSHAVWRMAAIGRPAALRPPRFISYVLKTAGVALFVLGLHFVLRPETLAGPMVMMGAVWAGFGVFSRSVSREGRRTLIAIGLVVLAAGTLLEFWQPSMVTLMLVGTAVLAFAPVALGTYQTLRG